MARKLNPHFFDENFDIKIPFQIKLIKIARKVVEELKIVNPMLIDDILLTGSMANYNWTPNSDIDLHIVFNFKSIDKNVELVKLMLNSFKYKWNHEHNITLYGHTVEIYFQDSKEEHNSTGIFSILKNKWLKIPSRRKETVDMNHVRKKYKEFVFFIKELRSEFYQIESDSQYEQFFDKAVKFKKRLLNYRKEGLTKNKEFSVENIVFKKLRHKGWLKLLLRMINKAYDGIFTDASNLNIIYEKVVRVANKRHHKRNLIGTTAKKQYAVAKLHRMDNSKNYKIEDLKRKLSGMHLLNEKDVDQVIKNYHVTDLSPDKPRKLGSTGITIKWHQGFNCYYAEKTPPIVRPEQSKTKVKI